MSDADIAAKNGAPLEVVALIRKLERRRKRLGQLRAAQSHVRAREAIARIEDEIASWTRDLGFGWGSQ